VKISDAPMFTPALVIKSTVTVDWASSNW